MPLYQFVCPEDATARETFDHVAEDLGAATILCACGSTMARVLSVGRGLTYFEEGRARVIHNLGHEPVTITSHEQHRRLMRERGLEWATGRAVQGTGGWV
jgi:hypothetical protein